MIRFACSNCGREYHLPDALAHLPLLCKGCGQRLTVPDPTPDPDPEPFPEPPPVAPGVDVHFTERDVELPPLSEVPEKPAVSVKRTPVAAEPPPARPSRGRVLGVAADVVAGVVLAGVGMLLGEFATGRGTGEILREAGGAPKFPPVDLLLWLGCVAAPVLGYVLFANRGKSVGAWLRTRL